MKDGIIEIDEVLHQLNLQIRRDRYAKNATKQLMKGVRKTQNK
jgi:hypothetical protein